MTAAPIIVAAPTYRSGTTLVQRLITSSENGICYGEDAARRLISMGEFAYQEFLHLDANDARNELTWKTLASGDLNQVMAGLELPGDFTKHAITGALTFFKQHYDEATRALEKEVWACKARELSFLSIAKLSDFFGDLKCVYVYRNVFDTIRSQKSSGLLDSRTKLAEACTKWVENTKVVAALAKSGFKNKPAMLHPLAYETFQEDPVSALHHLEQFCGLQGINPYVLQTRVNTFRFPPDNDSPAEIDYVPPVALSADELEIIQQICGARMQQIYPDLMPELTRH